MTVYRHARLAGAPRRLVGFAFTLTIVTTALVAACGAASPSATPGTMAVSGAWARASMSGDTGSAAYFTIANQTGQDDTLVGVSSPAGKTEMHQSMPGDSSMMGMQPVAKVAIAKGASVEFKAGGYHVMLTNLTATLQAGTTIQLTLTFEHAAPVTVAAEVRAN